MEANICVQSIRYGEQIRLLEDRGMEEDSERVREAWVRFKAQLSGTEHYETATFCYISAYFI